MTKEVLPAIRKNGYYVSPAITDGKIAQLQEKLKESRAQLESKEEQLGRMYNIQNKNPLNKKFWYGQISVSI